MIKEISSAKNQICKDLRALSRKKVRDEKQLYIIEGIKSVRDALAAGVKLEFIAVSVQIYPQLDTKEFGGTDIYIIAEQIFTSLSDTVNPQGILAAAKMPEEEPPIKSGGAYIYCDGVNDPGNLGTIVRTADAAGFDGVILSPDCADIYNPKTVRACMGSLFHIPIFKNIAADDARIKDFRFIGGVLSDKAVDYKAADYTGSVIIALGNEANGLSQALIERCTPVTIPIYGGAESLNVAVAGGILIYEAVRNRRFSD